MIPDFSAVCDTLENRCAGLPQGLAVGLCVAGLLYLFVGTYIRRGLSVLNFGVIGALLALGMVDRIGSNPALTAWAGAMVLMAITYPAYRAAQAGTGFAIVALVAMILCAVLGVPNGLTLVLMVVLGLMTMGFAFAIEHKTMAAVLAIQGSLLLLAGSFQAPHALGLSNGFPLYNMMQGSYKTVALLLCIILPAGIGFSVQMAMHDPTIRERPGR